MNVLRRVNGMIQSPEARMSPILRLMHPIGDRLKYIAKDTAKNGSSCDFVFWRVVKKTTISTVAKSINYQDRRISLHSVWSALRIIEEKKLALRKVQNIFCLNNSNEDGMYVVVADYTPNGWSVVVCGEASRKYLIPGDVVLCRTILH